MPKAPIQQKEMKILWGRSGGKCAICKCDLIREKEEGKSFPIGVMAHIEGEKGGAARYNPNMKNEDRSKYENLILLCPTDHEIIDKNPEKFTVTHLKKLNQNMKILLIKVF